MGCRVIDKVRVRTIVRIGSRKFWRRRWNEILKGMGWKREMKKGNRPGFETTTLLNFGARLRSRLIDSANTTKHKGNVHTVRFCTNR
jgi:hypothetical protein